jgi:hypothetical protein
MKGDSSAVEIPATVKDTIWDKKTDSLGVVIDSTMRIVDVPNSNINQASGPLFKIFTPTQLHQREFLFHWL